MKEWKFTADYATTMLPRLLSEAEKKVSAIETAQPKDYESLVWALDDATDELWHTWGMVSHLLGVCNSKAWREVEERFQGEIVAFSLRVGQSRAIYDAARGILASDAQLEPTRQRILEKMVESAKHAGVGLEGNERKRFNEIQAELAKLAADFHNAVIDATTPEIADAVFVEAMKHEKDRAKREELYRKRSTRAPENLKRIDRILALRAEQAKILGFEDYAALSLDSKCAPSVKAVFEMIDRLDKATVEAASRERDEIEKLSAPEKLEPWDVAFYAERLREQRYAYSEDELKQHFEFAEVLAGLFKMTKFLFDVEVEEVKDKPAVWHSDVRYFAVRERGETIANFYLDAYARPGEKSGGAWMNEFRNRKRREWRGGEVELEKPQAVVVLNLKAPDENGKSLMPLREVETLFHEFGHALQCMLTRVDEEDAAGINLVEWDAVEVASQFMENWCLDDRTGIKLPAELKAKVRAAKNFRAASDCRRQLAFAKTDLELHHGAKETPTAVKKRNFQHFGLPFVEGNRFLCAFTHIFAGGYAAGYYGYKWAEVMSADCFGAFEDAGLADDDAIRKVGEKYRQTILALGGSKSALEVFKDFRGRAPEIDALLRQTGIAR